MFQRFKNIYLLTQSIDDFYYFVNMEMQWKNLRTGSFFFNRPLIKKSTKKMIFNCNFMYVHQMSTKSFLIQNVFFFQKGVTPLNTSSRTLEFINLFQTQNTGPYRVFFYSVGYLIIFWNKCTKIFSYFNVILVCYNNIVKTLQKKSFMQNYGKKILRQKKSISRNFYMEKSSWKRKKYAETFTRQKMCCLLVH